LEGHLEFESQSEVAEFTANHCPFNPFPREMTVRSKISAALAIVAVLWLGGCGGGERTVSAVETDDSGFRQGQQLVRQGRDAEALTTFLRVIERRGEQSSAESHLEAGLIYLRHSKDPIEAIHHFRKYLELQPNAKQAVQVRGLIDTARREYARTLPGRPLESQVTGINLADRVKDLERENDDLKSEIAGLRALAPSPALRVSRATIDSSEPPPVTPTVPLAAPVQIRLPVAEPERAPLIPPQPRPVLITPPPASKSTPVRPAATKASASRRHTVAPGDTLYNIAKKYGVKMEDIVAANRDQLPSVASPLRKGAELRIP
jgi:tetratricopeptide (TPR) repeat protein